MVREAAAGEDEETGRDYEYHLPEEKLHEFVGKAEAIYKRTRSDIMSKEQLLALTFIY